MTEHVAHICLLWSIFAVLNIQIETCVAASQQSEPTLTLIEKNLACSWFARVSGCSLRGGGKWQFLHWRVLGESPTVTPLHGCLSSHLKWKCTPRFKRRNRRASESTSPPPKRLYATRPSILLLSSSPDSFRPSNPILAFSLTLTHDSPSHSLSCSPQPRHFMVC